MGHAEKTVRDDLVLIGQITKPHGTAGEVKVKSLTDFPARFEDLKRVLMAFKNGALDEIAVQNVRFGKSGAIIIKFCGINSISEASEIIDAEIAVKHEDCVKLPPDYYYIFDLVGMQVVLSHGDVIGTIKDVDSNTAQALLIVKTVSGKTVMLPFVKEIIPKVLMSERKIIVNEISGLFDEAGS